MQSGVKDSEEGGMKDMLIFRAIVQRAHSLLDGLEQSLNPVFGRDRQEGAESRHLLHGVEVVLRVVKRNEDQGLEEVIALPLVGFAQHAVAEGELLVLGVVLDGGKIVADREGESCGNHARTPLNDDLKNAFGDLSDLRVMCDSKKNGAVRRGEVMKNALYPVDAVHQSLLHGEMDEGKCVGRDLAIGAVAQLLDGGRQGPNDARQPVIRLAGVFLLHLHVSWRRGSDDGGCGDLWEGVRWGFEHGWYLAYVVVHASNSDDLLLRVRSLGCICFLEAVICFLEAAIFSLKSVIYPLKPVNDLNKFGSSNGPRVVLHALQIRLESVVLDGERLRFAKQGNKELRNALKLKDGVLRTLEEFHVQRSGQSLIDAPNLGDSAQQQSVLSFGRGHQSNAFLQYGRNSLDFVQLNRCLDQALDAQLDSLHAVHRLQPLQHGLLVGVELRAVVAVVSLQQEKHYLHHSHAGCGLAQKH